MKLNPLQTRTLALLQEMASDPELVERNDADGSATITVHVHGHGDHVHIGRFTVSSRFASGLNNQAVWTALERKGLAHGFFPYQITLTKEGLAYKTGVREDMLEHSDH